MFVEYNPNPYNRRVGDCAVRAVAKALNEDWDTAFTRLIISAYEMGDMPSSDSVWGATLRKNGFRRETIPNDCPNCYTVAEFVEAHPTGTYVLALGGHVLAVDDGNIYDSWDSSNEIPQYYYTKEE